MYHLMGINPEDEFYTPEGRPVKIVKQRAGDSGFTVTRRHVE